MFADRLFQVARESRVNEADMVGDLELDTVWDAMSDGDGFLGEVARRRCCPA